MTVYNKVCSWCKKKFKTHEGRKINCCSKCSKLYQRDYRNRKVKRKIEVIFAVMCIIAAWCAIIGATALFLEAFL